MFSFHNIFDIANAVDTARNNIASHIVLADWNIAQYRIMLDIARTLDKLHSKDAVDRSTAITLHVIGQLLCPGILPSISVDLMREHYGETVKLNQPHQHLLSEKRNDMFASTIQNCKANRVLGIFGHAHILPIVDRLTGQHSIMNPFQNLRSHNIQF